MTQESWVERGRDCLTLNYNPQPVVFERGEGAILYDQTGKGYLDFTAGIAVCALGHGHPALTETITQQASKLLHVSNLYFNQPSIELAEKLTDLSFASRVYFANSGAEANEAAIKLVRRKMQLVRGEDRFEIISTTKSFHGRTWAAISATGQPKYHKGFAPLVPGFVHVPYNDLEAMASVISDKTCAVLVEPIQGEGGVVVPSPGYLSGLRRLCDEVGAYLIFDEVQTGVARTGNWFAHQFEGAQPDVMTLAKGLGGGVPIGAMLCNDRVADGFEPGAHATTFGGNPLVCAVANTVLAVVEKEGLVERARELGAYFAQGLEDMVAETPGCLEVRGRGLMRGVGVDCDRIDRMKVVHDARARGLLITSAGPDAIRMVPPLIISEAQIDDALERLQGAIKGATA